MPCRRSAGAKLRNRTLAFNASFNGAPDADVDGADCHMQTEQMPRAHGDAADCSTVPEPNHAYVGATSAHARNDELHAEADEAPAPAPAPALPAARRANVANGKHGVSAGDPWALRFKVGLCMSTIAATVALVLCGVLFQRVADLEQGVFDLTSHDETSK